MGACNGRESLAGSGTCTIRSVPYCSPDGVIVVQDGGHPVIGSDELHVRAVESVLGGFLEGFSGHPLPVSVATIRLQHADTELDQRPGDTGEVHDAAQHEVGVAPAQDCIAVEVQRAHVLDDGFIPAGNAKAQMARFGFEGKKMALHEVALKGVEPTGLAQRGATQERYIHDASTLQELSSLAKQEPHHSSLTTPTLFPGQGLSLRYTKCSCTTWPRKAGVRPSFGSDWRILLAACQKQRHHTVAR